MYLTNARTAILGALVAFVFYPFCYALRRRSQHERSIMGTTLLMAYPMIMVATAALVLFWPRATTMVLGGGQHRASPDAHSQQLDIGIPEILIHPFGFGGGRGNEALGSVNPAGVGTVDTYYLRVLPDYGIIALPLFLLTFLIPAWLAFKNNRDSKTPEQELLAPLSIGIISLVIVKSVLTLKLSIPLAFAYVGCVIGLIWQRDGLPKSCSEAPAEPVLPPGSSRRARAGPAALAARWPGPDTTALPAPGYRR